MQSSSHKPLLVLNASAGSGKTFNLVRNYLRLLLIEGEDKAELGQIIAMTFTNKAALEMKSRIVTDLNKLANGGEQHARFRKELAEYIGLEEEKIKQNAKIVLKKMLHQYENFNVLTIDKFNLRLIRSFCRDLNLPEQFEIAMDDSLVLEKAVDELLGTIDEKEKSRLYDLAINFAKSNLDEENRWNIKAALLDSAAILNNERFFETVKKMTLTEFSEADLKHWKIQLKTLLLEASELQRNLIITKDAFEVSESDLAGKSNFTKPIKKYTEAKGNTAALLETFSFTPTFLKYVHQNENNFGPHPFFSALNKLIDFWNQHQTEILELELKTKQFYLLSVLKELALSMDTIREKEAIIRISEFNRLVSDLVKDEDAPFIYERLGSRFGHFFLDEFQDTSRLQWLNLIPLVHESLSNGRFNFVVGDPKQSIYRFKNGVAEQFVALPRIYNPEKNDSLELKSDFFHEMGTVEGLEDNWRSAKNIVQFNNTLFEALKADLPLSGKEHYNQIHQNPKGKDGGYIEITIDAKNEEIADKDLEHLTTWVNSCLEDGYQPADICILSRIKRDCNRYANHLKSNGFSVVSSDSLLVDSDATVQLIINFLKWRSNPNELQYAMLFAERFFEYQQVPNSYELYAQCFETKLIEGKEKRFFSIERFTAQTHFDSSLLYIGYQNLYSLIQLFLRSMKIDELQNAYVHQLLDLAFQFDHSNGPDLINFLSHYSKKGKDTNVQLPENKDSIQIMTAHKSKGLEFPIVIIPSLSFSSSSSQRNKQLIEINGHFIETKLTNKDALLEEVSHKQSEEKDAETMDAYNLLYVALTRPVDRLYLYDNQGSRPSQVQKELLKTFTTLFPTGVKDLNFHTCIGEKPIIQFEKESSISAFKAKALDDFLWFPEISLQSNEEAELSALNKQQRLGKQFHLLMENSRDFEEAQKECNAGIRKGIIEIELKEELLTLAQQAFENSDLIQLLQLGSHLDERTIALDEKTRLRPDKIVVGENRTVVIDFKTGEENNKHHQQVNAYCFALQSMKYQNIEGYLYYAGGKGLVAVNRGLF